jgi:hypothetical protein
MGTHSTASDSALTAIGVEIFRTPVKTSSAWQCGMSDAWRVDEDVDWGRVVSRSNEAC